jgi:hypothetical protein
VVTYRTGGPPEATRFAKLFVTVLLLAVIGLVLSGQLLAGSGVMLIMLAISVNLHMHRYRYFKTHR